MRRLAVSIHSVPPARTTGDVAVVIDVLRWSTSVVTALANGAAGVEAFDAPEDAMRRAREIAALTAGERHAHRIAGFDLGNSPLEFTRERVAGRVICCSTTNGTRALLSAAAATHRYVAALVNLRATAAAILAKEPERVDIICAGSSGEPSAEDSACADALVALLTGGAPRSDLVEIVRRAPHAELLRREGFGADVEVAVAIDTLGLVAKVVGARVVTDV